MKSAGARLSNQITVSDRRRPHTDEVDRVAWTLSGAASSPNGVTRQRGSCTDSNTPFAWRVALLWERSDGSTPTDGPREVRQAGQSAAGYGAWLRLQDLRGIACSAL